MILGHPLLRPISRRQVRFLHLAFGRRVVVELFPNLVDTACLIPLDSGQTHRRGRFFTKVP